VVDLSWQRHDGFVLVAAPTPWPPVGRAPAAAAESLRIALLQGFAEDAAAVVCDLAGGPVDGATDVVAGVARRVSPWPGALLAVVTADRYARARLEPAAGNGLRLAADREHAADLVRGRTGLLQARGRLEPALRAPAIARALLRETLAAWGGSPLLDDALVVADELVANAVLHAGTEMELHLTLLGGSLGIAVADRSPRRPALGRPGGGAESGRGLLLVDALADAWQVLPRHDGGKVVRAVLHEQPPSAVRIPAPVSRELPA
jgi:anti-sigma regulatory factor (Ser/Thr protein kinase)